MTPTSTTDTGSGLSVSHDSSEDFELLNAYWRAANYLSVGQIYLLDNPLLTEPLRAEHIKPRLLGHWGTTPGLNFIYAHLNRVIKAHDLNAMYVTGPGHGGPGIVANTYLEGTYSEVYPGISQDVDGMRRLFRQFSFPGGIPSHVAPETPGSIHEGGELGYALVHAYGAAFDSPDLLVCAVVGDGEAESGPSWTDSRSRAPSAPIRCRSPTPTTTRRTWRCSRSGCAATARRSCSITTAGCGRRSPRWRPPATGA